MSEYVYHPFNSQAGTLRLIRLQPGNYDDELRATIIEASLPTRTGSLSKSDQLRDLQKTLPKRWRAVETIDNRILFYYRHPLPAFISLRRTSWAHPNPKHPYLENSLVPTSSDSLEYEALSYMWGSAEPSELLHIASPEDCTADVVSSPLSQSSISIRPNLASALRHLRNATESRLLWVDAICINQNDSAERSQQVAHMDSIFELATRVIIWLGPASEDSQLGLQTLELFGKQIEVLTESGTVPAPDRTHRRWHIMLSCNPASLLAARNLLARPYFLRLWIWQEVILGARNAIVHCGMDQIRWYYLRRAIVLLRETNFTDVRSRLGLLPNPLLCLPYYTAATARVNEDFNSDRGIVLALAGTARAKSEDPRDRIYSLLGICEKQLARNISIDYTAPPEQVFLDFSLVYLQQCRSLALLRFCDLSSRRTGSVTWVPDFTNLICQTPMATFAAADTQAETNLLPNNVLSVSGVQVATVKAVCDYKMPETPLSVVMAFRAIQTWFAFGAQYHDPGDYVSTFFQVIFCGWIRDRWEDAGLGSKQCYSEFLRLSLPFKWKSIPNIYWVLSIVWNYIAAYAVNALLSKRRKSSVTSQESIGCHEPSEDELSHSILMHHFMRDDRNCSFFCTEQGHIALGPVGTKPGDIVSVLLGCDRVMVLRPCADDKFQVVGPSYIHGFNEAQGLLGPIPEPWEIKLSVAGHRTYRNRKTGTQGSRDPRLERLVADYVRLHDAKSNYSIRGSDDDRIRWTSGILKTLGIAIRQFQLI